MFASYQKRISITSYGGNSYGSLHVTGFEQVVTNGIPTYYVIDFSTYSSVIQFDQHWNYQTDGSLSYYYSHTLKYVDGYFYISAYQYFYKTGISFNMIASYYNNSIVFYRSIYFDSSSSLFYVTGGGISVFDTNCNFQRYMTLGGYTYSPGNVLSYLNGNFYVDSQPTYYDYDTYQGNIAVASQATGAFVAEYDNICSGGLNSVSIDSFGYMAVSCWGGSILLYNAYNGTFLNLQLAASSNSWFTAVDASGRFVSMSSYAIDIYY